MIGHQAIRKEFDWILGFGFKQECFECGVIVCILEEWDAFCRSIENVKHDTGGPYSKTSRHGR